MREPRPDWSPLGVNFKILDEHPHLFYISSPPRGVDNVIHCINHYPVDNIVCFMNTYLPNSDVYGGYCYSPCEQLRPVLVTSVIGQAKWLTYYLVARFT